MTELAKKIDLLEKKIKCMKENYAIISMIISEFSLSSAHNILDYYENRLRNLNEERKKETKQIDLEEAIETEKILNTTKNEE